MGVLRIVQKRRRRSGSKLSPQQRNRLVLASLLLLAVWWWIPSIPTPRMFESWPAPDSGFTAWEPMFQGIDYSRANFATPRPMKCHAVRIDLRNPGVSFFVKPSNGDRPLDTDSQFPSDFLRKYHLQLAVSSSAFFPFVKWPGLPVSIMGLSVSDGDRYAKAVDNLDSLVITGTKEVRIVPARGDTHDAWNGMGGNLTILRNGIDRAEALPAEAASAAGVSADGRYLFWLMVDGRQPGWSEGATPGDSARMLKSLGASDAINFDGGSVVTLVRERSWFGATVLNRPCHPFITGFERPIGGLLGIRAARLP
jgi:hypothetical protein